MFNKLQFCYICFVVKNLVIHKVNFTRDKYKKYLRITIEKFKGFENLIFVESRHDAIVLHSVKNYRAKIRIIYDFRITIYEF